MGETMKEEREANGKRKVSGAKTPAALNIPPAFAGPTAGAKPGHTCTLDFLVLAKAG